MMGSFMGTVCDTPLSRQINCSHGSIAIDVLLFDLCIDEMPHLETHLLAQLVPGLAQ